MLAEISAILCCQDVGGEIVDRWVTVREAINRLRQLEEQALIVDGFDVFAELTLRFRPSSVT